MKKRIFALVSCITLLFSLFAPQAFASNSRDTSFEESLAADLKTLGLFKGYTDTDFGLNEKPTRVQALVLLVRFLGKEKEATSRVWEHPFTDVPSWASNYVGYAYEAGLTNGISTTHFGSGDATASMYLSFMLRALGYSDKNDADFSAKNPFSLAASIGILPDCVDTDIFLRADVVSISYAALGAKMKNSTMTLSDSLISSGVFSRELFNSCYKPYAFSASNPTHETSEIEWTSDERQMLAYTYLRAWIDSNYNDSLNGNHSYQETTYSSSGSEKFAVIFDRTYDVITVYMKKEYQGTVSYSYTSLTSDGDLFLNMFSYYDSPYSYTPVFSGTSEIDPSTFGEYSTYHFSESEGDVFLLSSYEELSKLMTLSALGFADYVFENYVYGDYSLTDFGFSL